MLTKAMLEKALNIWEKVKGRTFLRYGSNGDSHALEAAIGLLMGKDILVGSFSSDTGYSGWWDEYRLTPDGVLEIRENLSDTSHFDPEKVRTRTETNWKKHLDGLLRMEKERIIDLLPHYEDTLELAARAYLITLIENATILAIRPRDVIGRVEWYLTTRLKHAA